MRRENVMRNLKRRLLPLLTAVLLLCTAMTVTAVTVMAVHSRSTAVSKGSSRRFRFLITFSLLIKNEVMTSVMTSYAQQYVWTHDSAPSREGDDSPRDILPRPGSVRHRRRHTASAKVPFLSPRTCPYGKDYS